MKILLGIIINAKVNVILILMENIIQFNLKKMELKHQIIIFINATKKRIHQIVLLFWRERMNVYQYVQKINLINHLMDIVILLV